MEGRRPLIVVEQHDQGVQFLGNLRIEDDVRPAHRMKIRKIHRVGRAAGGRHQHLPALGQRRQLDGLLFDKRVQVGFAQRCSLLTVTHAHLQIEAAVPDQVRVEPLPHRGDPRQYESGERATPVDQLPQLESVLKGGLRRAARVGSRHPAGLAEPVQIIQEKQRRAGASAKASRRLLSRRSGPGDCSPAGPARDRATISHRNGSRPGQTARQSPAPEASSTGPGGREAEFRCGLCPRAAGVWDRCSSSPMRRSASGRLSGRRAGRGWAASRPRGPAAIGQVGRHRQTRSTREGVGRGDGGSWRGQPSSSTVPEVANRQAPSGQSGRPPAATVSGAISRATPGLTDGPPQPPHHLAETVRSGEEAHDPPVRLVAESGPFLAQPEHRSIVTLKKDK